MGKKKKKNRNRRRDDVGNYTRLDGHVHVYMRDNPLAGGDGGMLLPTAIANAKSNGVTHMIVVMHDSLGGFVDYVQDHNLDPNAIFHEIDGVQVSFGAEVTCRDFQSTNEKGNTSKLHLLVVGPKLTPDSPIVKLLQLKTENDIMFDFGRLMFVAKANGIDLDPAMVKDYVLDKARHTPGYSSIGRKDILDFFADNGIDLAISQRGLNDLLDRVPPMPRMNIDMRDLIKVAHASGAMVIFAHPAVNLRRTTDPEKTIRNFFSAGGDGAESEYSDSSSHFDTMICDIGNELRGKNKVVRTPGSDTHRISSTTAVGKIRGNLIARNAHEKALEEIKTIEEARAEGKLTSRVYPEVSQEEVEGILKKYELEHNTYMQIYNEALIRFTAPPASGAGESAIELEPESQTIQVADVLSEIVDDVENTPPTNNGTPPVSGGDDNASGADGM